MTVDTDSYADAGCGDASKELLRQGRPDLPTLRQSDRTAE